MSRVLDVVTRDQYKYLESKSLPLEISASIECHCNLRSVKYLESLPLRIEVSIDFRVPVIATGGQITLTLPDPCPPHAPDPGNGVSMSKFNFFQNMVMLHIKLKRVTNAAVW